MDPPTKTTSAISLFLKPESSITFSTGAIVFLNKSMLSSSNLALDKVSLKSNPGSSSSISNVACNEDDKCLLAFSISVFNFWITVLSPFKSFPCCFFIFFKR